MAVESAFVLVLVSAVGGQVLSVVIERLVMPPGNHWLRSMKLIGDYRVT
jgi:hypothetical protein